MAPPRWSATASAATAKSKEPSPVDSKVWKACAGRGVQIPDVGSMVYYFPQGHVEQASSPPDFSTVPRTKPCVLCRVVGVRFLADQETDEVFAKLSLDPAPEISPATEPIAVAGDGGEAVRVVVKRLTASDANNGGGFSVPKFCADNVLPALDFEDDRPHQALRIRDLVGNEWTFRHIYRGTPRRHLLTTGWSKFVDAKQLVACDYLVFIRTSAGEVFFGIRRYSVEKGRVAAERVVEAVRAAEEGVGVFEVEYYPRKKSTEFVVAEEAVAAAVQVPWVPGIKVTMETWHEDDVRIQTHYGVVSGGRSKLFQCGPK